MYLDARRQVCLWKERMLSTFRLICEKYSFSNLNHFGPYEALLGSKPKVDFTVSSLPGYCINTEDNVEKLENLKTMKKIKHVI